MLSKIVEKERCIPTQQGANSRISFLLLTAKFELSNKTTKL